MLNQLFPNIEFFVSWLRGLGVLRVFWAKPFNEYVVLSRSPLIVLLYWVSGRKYKRGLLGYIYEGFNRELYGRMCGLSGEHDAVPLLLTSYRSLAPGYYDMRGVVYFYDTSEWRGLKPNGVVEIRVYENIDEQVIEDVRRIQLESWGFYRQPPLRDKVFIAYLGGEPVGAAYFNDSSFNVDFGVHVRRRYWRQRIGTRILYEITRYAREQGAPWISIVRVFRGVKPVRSDRQAMGFYDANNPLEKMSVYRLYCNMLSSNNAFISLQ